MSNDAELEAKIRTTGSLQQKLHLVAYYRVNGRTEDELDLLRELAVDAGGEMNLACALLALGRFAEGWPLYESRFTRANEPIARPTLTIPEWRGQPVERLLVWCEQGYGDTIQFARFLPLLRARGIYVSFVCPPALASLVEPLVDRLIPHAGSASLGPQDAHAMLCSVPRWLGVTTERAIPRGSYLSAQPRPNPGRVGVMTKGRPTHVHDKRRSLPDEFATRLLALPGAMSLDPSETGAADFRETAEIVAGLDLVVSVDTAVGHLAGALGKPVWMLLATDWTDWRWMRERQDSPWYPSARLIRQCQPGQWSNVVETVEAEWPIR